MEFLSNYFQLTLDYLVIMIDKIGYLGIFIGMFLESTVVPIPSEMIMIPAGVAAAYGKINLHLAIMTGVAGNLCGAIFNYKLAAHFGRPLLFKLGTYFFIGEKTILHIEKFFSKHGPFSTFIGRLIPGVRHYISLPAGVAKMDFKNFCFYTTAGASIWVTILGYLGFMIGDHKELVQKYVNIALIGCVLFCVTLTFLYLWFVKIIENKKLRK